MTEQINKQNIEKIKRNIPNLLTTEELEEKNPALKEQLEQNKASIDKLDREDQLKAFIFDKTQIIQKKVFTCHLINKNLFGFGFLLPKEEMIYDRQKNPIGIQQVWRAVDITSDNRGLVISKSFESKLKLQVYVLPENFLLIDELSKRYSENRSSIVRVILSNSFFVREFVYSYFLIKNKNKISKEDLKLMREDISQNFVKRKND